MLSGHNGRGLGHVTLQFLVYDRTYLQNYKLLDLETSNLVGGFVWAMPNKRTNNFPESGCGLNHVTRTIFCIRSNISLKILELETSNLIHGFVWAMPGRRTNKFP